MAQHLPPNNPVARELNGPWGDDQRIAHDISSHLRALVVLTSNIHRQKGDAAKEPTYLPTPEDMEALAANVRPPEQVAAERDHLQAVLARNNSN